MYYDGGCGLCSRSTRLLTALDWLGLLERVDMRTAAQRGDLPLPWEAALQGMPLRTRQGRVLVGFPAVRYALLRTPLGCPLALLLLLPGVSHGAAALYRLLARSRPRCAAGDPPPRTSRREA